MQAISDLYAQAGISPFSCSVAADGQLGLPDSRPVSTPNPNNTQSDETDNFSGTQELQGTNDVGSGNGQDELCSSNPSAPAGTTVDYLSFVEAPVDIDVPHGSRTRFRQGRRRGCGLPDHRPGALRHAERVSETRPTRSAPWSGAGFYPSLRRLERRGDLHQVPQRLESDRWPMAGFRPTPPTAAPGAVRPARARRSRTSTNTAISGGTGATSVAYRLFCQHGPSATPNTSQITDWGQLTNLGGNRRR